MSAHQTEDELRRVLHREARQADLLGGAPFEDVRDRARRIRRRRRTVATAAAAAAVVAITVPTALVLRDDQGATRRPADPTTQLPTPAPTTAPSPSPTGPTSSPSGQATPTRVRSLASIPRGADTGLTYLDGNGVVHGPGGRSRLPGPHAPDVQFVSYRGGWLNTGGVDLQLRRYDGTGRVVAHGRSGGIAVSTDRTQVAYALDGTVHQGDGAGMGNGEQTWSVPASSVLIGFLPDGPALTDHAQTLLVLDPGGTSHQVQVGLFPQTTSQAANLVGGLTGTVAKGDLRGAVVDLRTGARLWQNRWRPLRFSDDGTMVAAAPAADNGDPSSIAILDARTGRVLARTPNLGDRIFLSWDVAWDGDRVLFDALAAGAGEQQALLSLSTSGELTRASGLVTAAKPGGANAFLFDVQP